MGFTYIRKCAMACWTGGERQGMRVKSILAFLLRLGHALHWSGEGNIFLKETETGVVCLGSVKYVLWHKLKKKIVSFPPWEWRRRTSCWRKRVGSKKAKDGGWSMLVDGCPVETSSRFNQKITNGNPTLLLQLEEWSAILGRSKRGMGLGQGEISSWFEPYKLIVCYLLQYVDISQISSKSISSKKVLTSKKICNNYFENDSIFPIINSR